MLRLNKTKKSKYIVYIGWAGKYYADYINEVNDIIHLYGKNTVSYEVIK